MSSIDKNAAFNHLVGLIQHLNDNLHKWLTLHFSIQAALIVAISTLFEWATKQNGALHTGVILGFGVFGVVFSSLVGFILYRNRSYLNKYVEKAKHIEGENPFIWESTSIVKGPGLRCVLTVVHGLIAIGWVIFMVSLKCGS